LVPEQNTCFGRGRLDDLLSDPITGKKEFGLEEIGYLDSIGEEEHLYDINNLIEGTKYTRRFDDTIDHTVRLNGAQALAFNRARHCYENQAQSRDQKVLSFMMSIGSIALDVLSISHFLFFCQYFSVCAYQKLFMNNFYATFLLSQLSKK